MSRRTTLAVLILLVLATLGFVMWRLNPVTAGSAEPASVDRPAERVEAVEVADADPREARSVAPEAVAAPTSSVSEFAEPSSVVPEEPDLEAKTPLEFVVVDPDEHRVFDAEIRILGMRSEKDSTSWYPFRGNAAVARTDRQGRAKLDVWTWVDVDGRTSAVDLWVTHAEFAPFRDGSFRLAPGEQRIVLERGAVVSVRAWHGSPNQVVDDIAITLEHETALEADAWTRESDGRMVTLRIPPGEHVLRVRSRVTEPGSTALHSDAEFFTVRPNERVDLSVELRAAAEWSGKLDDSVPRPIVNGRVLLTLVDHFGTGASSGGLSHWFEAEVRADGSFTVRDLPPGRGYVFALCRGHVSRPVRAATLADAGITLPPGASPEDEALVWKDFGDHTLRLQRAEVPTPSPFTIAMEATGTVEITVKNLDGTPFPNAEVAASPDFMIPDIGSSLVPWREWHTKTDEFGVARFEDVPPDSSLWLGSSAEGYQMNATDRDRPPHVAVVSNEIARRTIVLEPIGDAVK